jgi:hypothetical protein
MFQYIHETPEDGYKPKHVAFVHVRYINTSCVDS